MDDPAETILDLIPRYPDRAMAVIRHLDEGLLHYISLMKDLSLPSVEARLANTLLRYMEMHGDPPIVPRPSGSV